MIERYRSSEMSLNRVYLVLGFTKQGYHQWRQRSERQTYNLAVLEEAINQVRAAHPGCGLEKLYHQLNPDCIARDPFIAHFQALGYGVKRRRNPTMTTQAIRNRYYPNLTAGLVLWGINRLWQTDITYIHVVDRFYYLVFIIDVYSRRIVGYSVSDRLYAEANRVALSMALRLRTGEDLAWLVHHSDRGSQYIDRRYHHQLERAGITQISMCERAQDNAFTERLNGTIKEEYLYPWKPTNFTHLKQLVDKAVKHYNEYRPHNGLIGRMSPVAFERWLTQVNIGQCPRMEIKPYLTEELETKGT